MFPTSKSAHFPNRSIYYLQTCTIALSPYHKYGKNRSPSPYAYPQQRNSSLNRAHYVISEKAPKEILIRVSTQEIQTENH